MLNFQSATSVATRLMSFTLCVRNKCNEEKLLLIYIHLALVERIFCSWQIVENSSYLKF